ncbi:hypothetical protein niasHS_000499 [Heterodera schachtii]|uniref:Cyclin-dependent kinase 5 activator n=1 Tax=Heterodera schachtii TaxID=97005 RepID=A0ABD2K577_HETSC
MGAQLSADGVSPGASSLGSNGQKGGATPRSASERSLAMSSSAASSSLHSARLRTLSGHCPSASPPAMAPFDQSNDFSLHSPLDKKDGVAYALFNQYNPHNDCGLHRQHGFWRSDGRRSGKERPNGQGQQQQQHNGGFFRWQSFAKTLPSLMTQQANSYGNSAESRGGNCILNEKRNQRQWEEREMVDANNNNNYNISSDNDNEAMLDSVFPAPFVPSSVSYGAQNHNKCHLPQHFTHLMTDEKKVFGATRHNNNNNEKKGSNFSLKSSLRKSGSRFFSSIVRNGYFRALLSDEDSSAEEDEEEEEEEDEWRGNRGRRRREWATEGQRVGWARSDGTPGDAVTANPNPCHNGTTTTDFNHNGTSEGVCARGAAPPPARPSLRPSQKLSYSSLLPQKHLPCTQKPNLPTKSLRFSFKRHLMGGQQKTTTVESVEGRQTQANAGTGTVSSVLLAMAAGQKPTRAFPVETDHGTGQTLLDWNGNGHSADAAQLILPWHDDQMTRKKIVHASSAELMRALGAFIGMRCDRLKPHFEPIQLTNWLRSVDRALILQGWQDVAFINPANLVFLFMLIRDSFALGECVRLRSLDELHSFVLLCLYISYSYMGNEISYPLKPFITEQTNRSLFWSQCVQLITRHSAQMLRLNSSSAFFLEVFTELKRYSTSESDDY